MAPVPATLDISFTSNFPAGTHTVYYRISGSGPVYSTVSVSCTPYVPPAPAPTCTVSIPIMVDNESCDPVTYEGYVQANCEPEDSPYGRIPFSVTFTPSPTCIALQYTSAVGPSVSFALGENCDGSLKPTVTIPGGTTFNTCYSSLYTPPTPPENITATASTECCYDCKTYTVKCLDDSTTLVFSDCTEPANATKAITIISAAPDTVICAVEGSVFTTGNSTITMGAAC
jgi:hypothetical protein